MFGNRCEYCNEDDCWGHSNDEKSALDQAKRSGDAASLYYKKLESALNLIRLIKLDLEIGGELNSENSLRRIRQWEEFNKK